MINSRMMKILKSYEQGEWTSTKKLAAERKLFSLRTITPCLFAAVSRAVTSTRMQASPHLLRFQKLFMLQGSPF